MASAIGARRITEIGCGNGSRLVAFHPGLAIVGIDDATAIEQCRAAYDVGTWLVAGQKVDLAPTHVADAIVFVNDRGIKLSGSLAAAKVALDGGALAAVIAVHENATPGRDVRAALARHRLDAYMGRTAMGSRARGNGVVFAVAPGHSGACRESIATWWAHRQPWERQLASIRSSRFGVEITRESTPDVQVTVVTESGADPAALRRTADSLVGQTFDNWTWRIVSQRPMTAPIDDSRVEILCMPSRAAGMTAAVGDQDFVAVVDEGVELRATTLERWLWYLETHPDRRGVRGEGTADAGARLYRGQAIATAGGLDAAWTMVKPLGHVAYTGARLDPLGELVKPDEPFELHGKKAWITEEWPFRNARPSRRKGLMLLVPWMTLGGADRVNLDLMRGLKDDGWEISVVTTRRHADHALYPTYEAITPDLFPLGDAVPLSDYPRTIDYLIDSRRPDVVLTSHSELGYRLLPYLRTRHPHTAFIDLCHSEIEAWYEGGFPRFSVEYQSLLDMTIVISEHLRAWMVARGADPDRVAVCHANVDHERFAPDPAARTRVRRHLGIGDDEQVVLWVGRISDEKRPTLLPPISAALRRSGVAHTMLVIGDGPERAQVEALAEKTEGGRIVFLGEIDHPELPAFYSASDAFVLPSVVEGIALTLFEAMSSALPVVASRIGGQAELVSDDVGTLVDPLPLETAADRYADALAAIMHDPARRVRMGRAGRSRIERLFTHDVTAKRVREIIDASLEHHRVTPRPVPDVKLGRALASESIELARRAASVQAPQRPHLSRRERVYRAMQHAGGPVYRWGLARDLPGLSRARNLARRVIVGE